MNRHELDEEIWAKIENCLKNDKETWRGLSSSKRQLINDVLTLLKNKQNSQLNWNKLGSDRTKNQSQCRKFNRWRNADVWEKVLEILLENEDYHWIAEFGSYEVLFRNSKLLFAINEIIHKRFEKDMVDVENYCETKIKKVQNEQSEIIESYKNEITKLNKEINDLNDEITKEIKLKKLFLKERNDIAKTCDIMRTELKHYHYKYGKN